jgi:hypothetical protein
MGEVREFELLFLDLFKRTLAKTQKKDSPTPVVIIADPGVDAKEN